jgi:hypothetical protein
MVAPPSEHSLTRHQTSFPLRWKDRSLALVVLSNVVSGHMAPERGQARNGPVTARHLPNKNALAEAADCQRHDGLEHNPIHSFGRRNGTPPWPGVGPEAAFHPCT